MFGGFPRSRGNGPQGGRKSPPQRPLRQKHQISPALKKVVYRPLSRPPNVGSELAARSEPVVRTILPSDLPTGAYLSILVRTSGDHPCLQLLSDLEAQIVALGDPPVEVLIRQDSGHREASDELSTLLAEASGVFVVFLGAGDEIAEDYVRTILKAITKNHYVGCIGMKGLWSPPNGVPKPVTYSVRNQGDYESGGIFLKPPGPSTPIRRDIASRYEFRLSGIGIGRDWSLRILSDRAISKEIFVDKVLYHHAEPSVAPDLSGQGLKISCILTSYNRPTFLRQALTSLQNQTHKNFELLIFDDSSKMDIVPILKEFNLPVSHLVVSKVTPKERGSVNRLSLNVNKGLRLATGSLVCFLADDDYYFPGWFEGAAAFFSRNPKVNVGYGWLGYTKSRTMEFRAITQSRWPGGVVLDPFEIVDHNQVMHRRFKVPHAWPEGFSTVTNPDAYYFRALSKGNPFHPIGSCAAVKRVHSKNIQLTASDVAAGRVENLRE